MLLAIDVGNTNTVLGVYRGRELLRNWRLQTEAERTVDEYGVLLHGLFGAAGMEPSIDGVVVSCVVPPMQRTLDAVSREYLRIEPTIVGPGISTGMPILYDKPQEVGADRIVNAIAAYERTRDTTHRRRLRHGDDVRLRLAKGEYVGGVIAPGLGISREALFERAAKLYASSWRKPKHVVGRNTVHAIQSGIVYGYVALVDGLVARIQRGEQGQGARASPPAASRRCWRRSRSTIEEVDEFLDAGRAAHHSTSATADRSPVGTGEDDAMADRRCAPGSATSASSGRAASARPRWPMRCSSPPARSTRLGRVDDGTSVFDFEPEETRAA